MLNFATIVTALALLAAKYTLHYYLDHKAVYHCNFISKLKNKQTKPKQTTTQNHTKL